MHYKRGKPHEKKDINWGTPRAIQMDRKETHSVPSRNWRKLYACHKLKGDHEFVLDKEDRWKIGDETILFQEFHCVACGADHITARTLKEI